MAKGQKRSTREPKKPKKDKKGAKPGAAAMTSAAKKPAPGGGSAAH